MYSGNSRVKIAAQPFSPAAGNDKRYQSVVKTRFETREHELPRPRKNLQAALASPGKFNVRKGDNLTPQALRTLEPQRPLINDYI